MPLKHVDCCVCVPVVHQVDQQAEEEKEEEEGGEVPVQLQTEDVTFTTLDLREHEVKPSKKKRKNRKEKKTEAPEEAEKLMEKEGIV